MLRDAQAHPEKYENLQVRVCGWNVLWNNMAKSEQDAYILRAENIAQ
jgi:pyruvate-formate lyase